MVETSMVRPPGRLTVRCRGLMADVSGPGSVSVFDRLIDHGPEVVDKMRRIRGGHSDLSEQDSGELFVRVGVRRGAASTVPAELADGSIVAAVGAYRHPEAPAAVRPWPCDKWTLFWPSRLGMLAAGREAVRGHQLDGGPGQYPFVPVHPLVQQRSVKRVIVVDG